MTDDGPNIIDDDIYVVTITIKLQRELSFPKVPRSGTPLSPDEAIEIAYEDLPRGWEDVFEREGFTIGTTTADAELQ